MANTNDKVNCDKLFGLAQDYCERRTGGSGGKDPCSGIPGPMKDYCDSGPSGAGSGLTGGASGQVKQLAESLIGTLKSLVAPKHGWAPETADSGLYTPFLWLGQHLAVVIFVCVIVVCALTAWQGAPRLKQMGASTGWSLAAVAGMASVPGVVMLLNKAVSSAFTAAFDSNETTLFGAIKDDITHGADASNPLAVLVIVSALVVALAFAALVFLTRNLGILAFVCMAPLVLASLARGGDMAAVKLWANRLLGLMFCPFALLLVAPFVQFTKGSLVVDSVLLVAADALMLRMIFHGVPYIGPRVAGAARELVELHVPNRAAHAVVRAGVPKVFEQENAPRGHRTVATPGRAAHQDRGVLFAAYGVTQHQRSPRLTTTSAVANATREAGRSAQIAQARRDARAAAQTQQPASPPAPDTRGPAAGPRARPAGSPGRAANPRPTPDQ